MAEVGAELESPATGERMVFRQTAASSNHELFQAELWMAPGHHVIRSHFHPHQVERFEVLEGKLGVTVGGALRIAEAGEEVMVPRAVNHSYWNAGPGELHILYEQRPGLKSAEIFSETLFALSRDGKLGPNGEIPLVQGSVLVDATKDFIRPAFPPIAAISALAVVGRMLGYRAWYPEYEAKARS